MGLFGGGTSGATTLDYDDGEGTRERRSENEFTEWHVAWLAERHN